jgi:hypothetical protein
MPKFAVGNGKLCLFQLNKLILHNEMKEIMALVISIAFEYFMCTLSHCLDRSTNYAFMYRTRKFK